MAVSGFGINQSFAAVPVIVPPGLLVDFYRLVEPDPDLPVPAQLGHD